MRAVAQAYRRLIEACPAGEVVNICSGRMHALREVIDLAASITGQRLRVEVNPAFVRANEVRRLGGSPARLRSIIGEWDSPPLDETLRWMLEAKA